MKKVLRIINEASEVKKAKDFMSRQEVALKKLLIELLKDDGEGHKHAKYAERLSDFDIKIVYYNENDPETLDFTAAISFDDGIIYISEGFLEGLKPGGFAANKNNKIFKQLSVLMRHEMAHNLMMHQIRMMHEITNKYGKEGYTHISMSHSLHELQNIIEDFEISNKRYSAADKIIVKNMWLNGKVIGGLVTEEIRTAWENMSVIDMYYAMQDEINTINAYINNALERDDVYGVSNYLNYLNKDKDFLNKEYSGIQNYKLAGNVESDFGDDIEKYAQSKKFEKIAPQYQEIITNIINSIIKDTATAYNKDDINRMIKKISLTSPIKQYNLLGKNGKKIVTVYTPEEKLTAVMALRSIIDNATRFERWREKVKDAFGSGKYQYSADDVAEIFKEVSKTMKNN